MSKYIIDRRKNPKGKSISNRQRFIRRAKKHLSERIHKNVVKRSITDKGQENISIPTDGIQEPSFNHDSNLNVSLSKSDRDVTVYARRIGIGVI